MYSYLPKHIPLLILPPLSEVLMFCLILALVLTEPGLPFVPWIMGGGHAFLLLFWFRGTPYLAYYITLSALSPSPCLVCMVILALMRLVPHFTRIFTLA